jgi:hypothetical protein
LLALRTVPSEPPSSAAEPDRNVSGTRKKKRPKKNDSPLGLSAKTGVLLNRYVEQLIEADLALKGIKTTTTPRPERKEDWGKKGLVGLGKLLLEVILENPIKIIMATLVPIVAKEAGRFMSSFREHTIFGMAGLISGIIITYAIQRTLASRH